MIAFIIAPFYLALSFFLLFKGISFYKLQAKPIYAIFTAITSFILLITPITFLIGFILPVGKLKRFFTTMGNYWFSIALYVLIGIGVATIIRLVFKGILKDKYNEPLAKLLSNIGILTFAILMSVYGIFNAHKLKTTTYELVSNKSSPINNLNIVLISDLHMGYSVGVKEIQDMADKVNALNPDLVLLSGDIFDNEFEALDDPEALANILTSIKSKYGNYAIYGNHDVEEKILCGFTFAWGKRKDQVSASKEMNDFVSKSGFTFLYDEYVEIKDDNGNTITYIYGRPDKEKPNFGNATRIGPLEITKGLDKSKYIICLDHAPHELDELASAGVDLDLNGHTHNGQVWPGTYTIHLFWKNAYGLKTFGNMNDIVTSGVGLFGPNMRTGCSAEIVNIKINFK